MTKNMEITEWQTRVANPAEWPLGRGPHKHFYRGRLSEYRYVRYDGNAHLFRAGAGGEERFGKRETRPAGWHLQRGAYFYEPHGG